MPSFDAVSKVNWSEVQNALNQAKQEVAQRFDFRGTKTELERTDTGIVIHSSAEDRARAALDVLEQKLVRRKVSLKHLDKGEPLKNLAGVRIPITIKEGIERDNAKRVIKIIKDSKLRVQAAIQEDTVRVNGKKRDDLQQVISLLKEADLDFSLQFTNFRD